MEAAAQNAGSQRVRRSRLPRHVATAFCLCGLVLSLVAAIGFFFFLDKLERYEKQPLAGADGIVVLTGGAERIADGVRLLAQGAGRRLLISGVNEKTTRIEVAKDAAKLNSEQKNLFDCCIDLDYRALNTLGNALEARSWAGQRGFRSLVVVTSSYHMPRTLAEFAHAMPTAQITPFPVISEQVDLDRWWEKAGTMRLLIGEYVKYLLAAARIRLEREPGSLALSPFALPPKKLAEGR